MTFVFSSNFWKKNQENMVQNKNFQYKNLLRVKEIRDKIETTWTLKIFNQNAYLQPEQVKGNY